MIWRTLHPHVRSSHLVTKKWSIRLSDFRLHVKLLRDSVWLNDWYTIGNYAAFVTQHMVFGLQDDVRKLAKHPWSVYWSLRPRPRWRMQGWSVPRPRLWQLNWRRKRHHDSGLNGLINFPTEVGVFGMEWLMKLSHVTWAGCYIEAVSHGKNLRVSKRPSNKIDMNQFGLVLGRQGSGPVAPLQRNVAQTTSWIPM